MVQWPAPLGVRLVVGHLTLDQVAEVRILDPQPSPQIGGTQGPTQARSEPGFCFMRCLTSMAGIGTPISRLCDISQT